MRRHREPAPQHPATGRAFRRKTMSMKPAAKQAAT
jgi:hypothetical protein